MSRISPRSHITFTSSCEEHLHNEDLQACHCNHEHCLDNVHVEYPLFRALDCAGVSVLARTEVLLLSRESRYLSGELKDSLFDAAELLD